VRGRELGPFEKKTVVEIQRPPPQILELGVGDDEFIGTGLVSWV
jgi:hypothetical protein